MGPILVRLINIEADVLPGIVMKGVSLFNQMPISFSYCLEVRNPFMITLFRFNETQS